jgi:CBS-domain-containing membrane protein
VCIIDICVGGATSLLAITGGPAIHAMGFRYVLFVGKRLMDVCIQCVCVCVWECALCW